MILSEHERERKIHDFLKRKFAEYDIDGTVDGLDRKVS
jgi:hypothetical protein